MVAGKNQPMYVQSAVTAFHGMVWGQVALGIATLYSFANYAEYYQYLSIAHLAWGALVWLVACGMVMNIVYGKSGRAHG